MAVGFGWVWVRGLRFYEGYYVGFTEGLFDRVGQKGRTLPVADVRHIWDAPSFLGTDYYCCSMYYDSFARIYCTSKRCPISRFILFYPIVLLIAVEAACNTPSPIYCLYYISCDCCTTRTVYMCYRYTCSRILDHVRVILPLRVLRLEHHE